MQKRNTTKICSLLMLLLTLANGSIAFGQASNLRPSNAPPQKKVSVDEDLLIEIEKALAERDKLRVQVAAKDAIILAKDEQILALKGLLDIEKEISASWKTAALERKSAITIDDKMITAFEKRVADLQAERDSARRNNKVWGAVGLVFGAALGFYANRK